MALNPNEQFWQFEASHWFQVLQTSATGLSRERLKQELARKKGAKKRSIDC